MRTSSAGGGLRTAGLRSGGGSHQRSLGPRQAERGTGSERSHTKVGAKGAAPPPLNPMCGTRAQAWVGESQGGSKLVEGRDWSVRYIISGRWVILIKKIEFTARGSRKDGL
jgi:hypothetical protein